MLIFMLSRRGCLSYATRMAESLNIPGMRIYVSTWAQERIPDGSIPIFTYRNRWEFLFHTLVILPIFLISLIPLLRKGIKAAYFPLFHHWNLFIIAVCRLFRTRVVVTVHESVPHLGEEAVVEQTLQNWCIKMADDLIFLSHHVQVQTQETLTFHARPHVIPHGLIALPDLSMAPRSLPVRPRLLFLGRLARYKGIDLLMEAIQYFPVEHYQLTIAGSPLPNFKVKFSENVQLIDKWLSEKEIVEILNSHDILVLPYREASQSGIVTLGIAAAIPIIATHVGGLTEQLEPDEAVWVAPTAADIRRGIQTLIYNPEYYEQLHNRLNKKRQRMSWKESSFLLCQVLRPETKESRK